MSRRTVVVEEEFDDETDLPLPNKPLPNTGTKGAILEALSDDEDDDDDGDPGPASGPATPSHAQFKGNMPPDLAPTEVKDITPYKKCASCPPTRVSSNALQVDLRLPYIHRCKESILHRRTSNSP